MADDDVSSLSPLIIDSNAAKNKDALDLRLILAAIFGALGVMIIVVATGLVLRMALYDPNNKSLQIAAEQLRWLSVVCLVGAGLISTREINTLLQIGRSKV